MLAPHEVREFYNESYELGVTSSDADKLRAQAYANAMQVVLGDYQPRRVLEVGCGSGCLLRELRQNWPDCTLHGIEAAPQLAIRSNSVDQNRSSEGDGRLLTWQAFLEDLPLATPPYDLVFAINVLEHSHDPRTFLANAAAQLGRGGRFLLVCPRTHPANVEILFCDHVHGFTGPAINRLAAHFGFACVSPEGGLPEIGDFQIRTYEKVSSGPRDGADNASFEVPPAGKFDELNDYLRAWSQLEERLMSRVATENSIYMFGAGEMAALIRCYAPRVWARVKTIVVDSRKGARKLDLPTLELASLSVDGSKAILVATHPRSQHSISRRLAAGAWRPVTFDDLISR